MTTRRQPTCYWCGDIATTDWRGHFACRDCRDELQYGIIHNQNIHFLGGRPGQAEPDDDGSPWEQNAVRIMEDGAT